MKQTKKPPRISKRGIANEGRPLKEIDPQQVENLAAINCSLAEMAAVLGCNEDTLTNRFSAVIKAGRERGTMSLKRKQYEVAMAGNVSMLIWMGKIRLDQREKTEVIQHTTHTVNNDETIERIFKTIDSRSAIKASSETVE